MYSSYSSLTRTALKLSRTLRYVEPRCSQRRLLSDVTYLKSWNIDEFRERAFIPQIPYCLSKDVDHTPVACQQWFTNLDEEGTHGADSRTVSASHIVLNSSFWQRYGEMIVPLEITSKDPTNQDLTKFEKVEAPLNLLLSHVSDNDSSEDISIYLAQHDLRDLPKPIQDDLPTPDLVRLAGKGDIYSSSLWLGRAPTYTPLHRDPNPNLFCQLAGSKTVRLFEPNIGRAIFEHVARILTSGSKAGEASEPRSSVSPALRGEEMMQGFERTFLYDLVWADPSSKVFNEGIMQHARQAVVTPGEALFIPKGWWHSVRSTGRDITASANWWFR